MRELILEHHRARTAFSKMQAQQQALNTSTGSTDPQPMDIGLMYKGKGKHKGKGKSYKGQSKGKTQWHNKGKGYTGYNNSGYGKGKAQTPIGYGNALKASGYAPVKGKTKSKGTPTWQGDRGKGKGACYKCGQMGHMARDCRI